MNIFEFGAGTTPLLVSMPHDGIVIPEDMAARMTDRARETPDTDWHMARLYDFAAALERRAVLGGTAPARVREQLEEVSRWLTRRS